MNDSIQPQTTPLDEMRLPDLQARYAEVFGEASKCPNRKWLIRKLEEAAAEQAHEADATICATPASEPTEDQARVDTEPPIKPPGTAPNPPGEDTPADIDQPAPAPRPRLTKLSVPELQALYAQVLNKTTKSQSAPYLIWKLRQAYNGKLPARLPKPEPASPREFKVLPLRLEAELVAQLDEAWKRMGLRSRTELFRRAVGEYIEIVRTNRTTGQDG